MDLSRIARGGTPITLDRPRLLLFDSAALWLLIQKYGNGYLSALYTLPPIEPGKQITTISLVLTEMEALEFYLWVGLQADCKLRGEELTIEEAASFIGPFTYPEIFQKVIQALMRDTRNPARKGDDQAGKVDAAAARPAVAAVPRPKPRRSTSSKKNASR